MIKNIHLLILSSGILIGSNLTGAEVSTTAASTTAPAIRQVDGVIVPRKPVTQALADAMEFLKKADGDYVPGKIDGELAGYFTSAFVNEDGSRTDRELAFPARQHSYFIFTFLRYAGYSGDKSWAIRAQDLAEWNLRHSTPPKAAYPNMPYSTYSKGKPGGSKDKDSIEPDKSAFFGSAYLALYDMTSNTRYLEAAKQIADTLVRHQAADGSWPFRVEPVAGVVRQQFGGAPVFYVQFFEDLLRHDKGDGYYKAHENALALMLTRNIEQNKWGTYHEDIVSKPEGYLSAEPMAFTADYLFRNASKHSEYLEKGRLVLRRMEERLVYTEGHPAAPAPAVSEQAGFEHLMPGHTARYCLALGRLAAQTGDSAVKKKALSGIHGLTYMQSEPGLFRTFFQSVHPKEAGKRKNNWYSQHLYTVCHLLELFPLIPELRAETKVLSDTNTTSGIAR